MRPYNRNHALRLWDHMYEIVQGECCVYCGDPREVLDHVPALSSLWWGHFDTKYAPFYKVPSCNACNRAIGPYPSISLDERRRIAEERRNPEVPTVKEERNESELTNSELEQKQFDEARALTRAILAKGGR